MGILGSRVRTRNREKKIFLMSKAFTSGSIKYPIRLQLLQLLYSFDYYYKGSQRSYYNPAKLRI